jgi:Protein of unknown function (DUF3347)
MKSFWYLFLVTGLFSCGNDAKKKPVEANESSSNLVKPIENQSLAEKGLTPVVNAYYTLKDALIEADTLLADKSAAELLKLTDSLKISEILTDSSLVRGIEIYRGNISAETKGLIGEINITEKRRSFSMISQNLLPLLQEVNFKATPVYQQICPMAFNDDEKAYWLSSSREIMNPYLGKKHPKYKAGMLHCGELGDSLLVK